jgi:hypothetical protein
MYIQTSRSLLSVTLLCCVLILTACMDESCNVTSPSETAGSHDPGTTGTLLVEVTYFTDITGELVRGLPAPLSMNITVGDAGPVAVPHRGRTELTVTNVTEGRAVAVTWDGLGVGGGSSACTWGGKKTLFGADASVQVVLQLDFRVVVTCRGW